MKKFTLLFSLLLLCLGATQLKAEKRIKSIGTNIATADAIVDGNYYILKQVPFQKCMYESATTGQIMAGNTPTAGSNESWSFIWQAHAEEGGKVSFSAPSGKYIGSPAGAVYTVPADNRDKVTISAFTGNNKGNWQVKSSLHANNYWDCDQGTSFTGWSSGDNIEYQIIPVEVEEAMYTTVATLPTTSTTEVVTGYYMLKQVNTASGAGGGGWIKAVNMAVGSRVTTTADVPVGTANSMAYLWYVEKNADNTISISTYGNAASWKINKLKEASMSAYADRASFTLHSEAVSLGDYNNTTPVAGSFLLSTMVDDNGTDVQTMVHNSGGNMGSWTDANPASLYNVAFYPIDESALSEGAKSEYTVTYIYKMNGTNSTKKFTRTAEANSIPAAPEAIAYYRVNSLDKTDAITCDVAVNVSGEEDGLPFEKTTDLNNPKWYAMLMHQNINNDAFVQYTALSTNLTADHETIDRDNCQQTDNARTLLSGDGYWWCFKGNVFDGFEIYNKAAGTDGTKKLAYGNGNPQVRENPVNYKWYISKSNEAEYSTDWTCFAKSDGNNLNKQGTTVAYWGDRDNGSSIKFYAPTDLVNINLAQLQQYLAVPDGAAYGSQYVETHRAELTAASDASAKFDTETILSLLDHAEAYNTSIANGELNEGVVAGKYYRLMNAYYDSYMAAGSAASTTDNVFGRESAENIDRKVGTIVQFVADGDNYKLYVQGKALGKCTQSNPVTLTTTEDDMGSYALSQTAGVCTLKDTKNTDSPRYAYLHSAESQDDKIVGWESSASASQWYIFPVTSVEVALNNVGDANYASLCLPFAVEGDGNTKLYTGTINGNELVMAEQTAVPANTGVVLKGAAATTTLNIVDNADAIGTNSLQGTCRPVASTGKLVLGRGNESGMIGFYVPSATLTELAANKAYLNVSDVSAASSAIAMNFGGEATGIGAVLGEEGIESNAPVFDLSGRRVMQTVKGGLYIQHGKKFIVK